MWGGEMKFSWARNEASTRTSEGINLLPIRTNWHQLSPTHSNRTRLKNYTNAESETEDKWINYRMHTDSHSLNKDSRKEEKK